MSDLNSSQTLGGFYRRENDALTAVYERNRRYVFELVHALVQGAPEAEDLAAEVFLALFESYKRFETMDAIRSFLHICARNICTKFLARRRTARKNLKAIFYTQPAVSNEAEEAQSRSAWRTQVMEAVKQLPERTRQVMEIHFLEELPNQLIAKKLGMSIKSVANHKARGLKLLKGLIEKQGLYTLLLLYLFK
ncbi:MAG TPA: sigma-70 family RNA polymerase sigma factor [Puia sp.]|nr:sigma-70 family RNA polymerase sigma factor [Puia sp.]